jgi:hypothetical protein
MRKAILTACAAGAATAAAVIIPGAAASASTTAPASITVKAVTISPLHSDTTSVSGTATQTDPQRGPVWGTDRLKETVTATKQANGKYNVKISFSGSTFAGFADPRTASDGSADPGGPLLSQGKITGSIQYNGIVSTTAPDPHNVRAVQAPNASLGKVLAELFHGHNKAAASTHYLINYTPTIKSVNVTGSGNTWAAGDTYTQAG